MLSSSGAGGLVTVQIRQQHAASLIAYGHDGEPLEDPVEPTLFPVRVHQLRVEAEQLVEVGVAVPYVEHVLSGCRERQAYITVCKILINNNDNNNNINNHIDINNNNNNSNHVYRLSHWRSMSGAIEALTGLHGSRLELAAC